MAKQEFKILEAPVKDLETKLNEVGDGGWSVVALQEISTTQLRVILQRSNQTGTLGRLGG